jgi:polysaccharide pyruvyl transferase WcaK-like protein
MKISIVNAYDYRNLGDLAILLCQVSWLKLYFKDPSIFIHSSFWKKNAEIFGDFSLPPLIRTDPSHNVFLNFLSFIYILLSFYLRVGFRFRRFSSYTLCILSGGGYFYSSASFFPSRTFILSALNGILAKRAGAKTFLFPQSIGPITKSVDFWFLKCLCCVLDRVFVRDRLSEIFLSQRRLGVGKTSLIPDIVNAMPLLLPHLYDDSIKNNGLGISVVDCSFASPFDSISRDHYLTAVSNSAAHYYAQTGEPIRLFVQVSIPNSDDDMPIAQLLHKSLTQRGIPVDIFPVASSFEKYILAIQSCRFFIGSRMHACIFALSSCVPCIGIAYQPKFFGLFEQYEIRRYVSPFQAVSTDWLCSALDSILSREDEIRTLLRKKSAYLANQVVSGLTHGTQEFFTSNSR